MPKQVFILLAIAALAGGVYFFLNYEVQTRQVNGQPAGWTIVRKGAPAEAAQPAGLGEWQSRPTLRIATFHLGRFDDVKLANPRVSEVLARLLPRFDLIALQGIRGKNQGVLIRLVEQISAASGRVYNFATCPTQQRDALEHYSAFVFDAGRIEVDRTTVRFVEDRTGRLRIKPLAGWFRARGPDPAEAFTFTLINVETDPDHTAVELDALADAYRAVRDTLRSADGRAEDDVILLGDLESDDRHLGGLGKLLGVDPLVSDTPTTVRGVQQLDNILIDRLAISEFTGRVEVVDMLREFEMTVPGATEVSEHLPVWAEFSVYENGQAGRAMADKPKP
jgi:deoxyribonuclease-1-like protein